MYVGHALIAFVVGLGLAHVAGRTGRRALTVGLVAAVFGLLPDVDLAYTVYAVVQEGTLAVFPTTEHVWTESWLVHRTLTHSLFVGAAVVAFAGAVAVLSRGDRTASVDGPSVPSAADPRDRRESASLSSSTRSAAVIGSVVGRAAIGLVAIFLAGSLGVLAIDADGELGAITMALFLAGAGLSAVVAAERGVPPSLVVLTAAIGIGLHPFGDLWMGRPPIAFHPIGDGAPLPSVRFAADPTLHFLGAVLVEVGLLAAALVAASHTMGRSVADVLSPFALIGPVLVVALAFVPAPTFQIAYQFSFAMVAIGTVAGTCGWIDDGRRGDLQSLCRSATTGAAAMAIGVLSYGGAYVVLGG